MFLRKMRSAYRRRHTIRKNVEVGEKFVFGNRSVVWAPRSLTIGRNVSLGSNVRIEVDGTIGDDVLIANSAAIVGRADHDLAQLGVSIRESRWVGDHPGSLSKFTTIGSDVWIGYGAIVLSGVSIGDSSVIGAGAVVTKDVPPNSIAVGNPARVIANRFDEQSFADHWVALAKAGLSRIVT